MELVEFKRFKRFSVGHATVLRADLIVLCALSSLRPVEIAAASS